MAEADAVEGGLGAACRASFRADRERRPNRVGKASAATMFSRTVMWGKTL